MAFAISSTAFPEWRRHSQEIYLRRRRCVSRTFVDRAPAGHPEFHADRRRSRRARRHLDPLGALRPARRHHRPGRGREQDRRTPRRRAPRAATTSARLVTTAPVLRPANLIAIFSNSTRSMESSISNRARAGRKWNRRCRVLCWARPSGWGNTVAELARPDREPSLDEFASQLKAGAPSLRFLQGRVEMPPTPHFLCLPVVPHPLSRTLRKRVDNEVLPVANLIEGNGVVDLGHLM